MFFRLISAGLACATAALCMCVPASAQAKPYKGGELYSQQQYKYGRMEMRMRMARGSGILSTFFTYKNGSETGGAFWEEVDIEVFGKDDASTWQSNIITGSGTRATSEAEHEHPTSLADDYHTYALVWTPEYVAWELDGTEVRRTTSSQVSELTSPQSLRFNIWAANIPSWVGDFDDSALPQYQYVNWISFYRYENGDFVHDWTDNFDTLDQSRWGRANWTFGENLTDFDPNNVQVKDGTLILAITREGQTGVTGTVPVDLGISHATGGAQNEAGGTGGQQDSGAGGAFDGNTGLNTGGQTVDSGSGGQLSGSSGGAGQQSATGGAAPAGVGGAQSGSGPVDGDGGCAYSPRPSALSRTLLPWMLLLGACLVGRRRVHR